MKPLLSRSLLLLVALTASSARAEAPAAPTAPVTPTAPAAPSAPAAAAAPAGPVLASPSSAAPSEGPTAAAPVAAEGTPAAPTAAATGTEAPSAAATDEAPAATPDAALRADDAAPPAAASVPEAGSTPEPAAATASAPVGDQASTVTRLALFAQVSNLWVPDPAFDLVGEDDVLTRLEVGAAWTPRVLGDALDLSVGYGFGASGATLLGLWSSSLDLHSLQAGARLRGLASSSGHAFVRATASLDFAQLAISEPGDVVALEDVAVLFGLEGTAGWELLIPLPFATEETDRRATEHLSLALEAGYALRPMEARFDELVRDATPDTTPARIELAELDAGSIDLSGVVLRVCGGLHF